MQNVLSRAKYSLILPFLVTAAFVVNFFSGGALTPWGIVPRETAYLPGILISPFIHKDFDHFLSNIVPLVIFSILLAQHGSRRYMTVVFTLILVVGITVWLVGRSNNHIGASGLIYGMFSYLVCHGWYERRVKAVIISVFVFLLYSGMAITVLRFSGSISWESHIAGFIAGAGVARFIHTLPI